MGIERLGAIACVFAIFYGACTAGSSGHGGATAVASSAATGAGGTAAMSSSSSSTIGVGGSEPVTGTLTGKVLAPNGTIPISGALIYLAKDVPPAIPSGVFCDKCVELTGQPYTLSAADGTFSLAAPAGDYQIVVQKGAFRRVRPITVAASAKTALPAPVTTLPPKKGKGDDIPSIAVLGNGYDLIENTLAKLGLGSIDGAGQLVLGSQSFDLYNDDASYTDDSLLTDYNVLSKYHIVFFPCANWYEGDMADPKVIANLRKFVGAGGRLYVTDWAYEVLNRAFANEKAISWFGDDGTLGSATTDVYDAPAQVVDKGLQKWLQAQNITNFDLIGNWTIVDKVGKYSAPDLDMKVKSFDPTIWVRAAVPDVGPRPATVSFEYGCGRAMFSTYHTEGDGGPQLLPQERALLYVLLEVAVCVGDIPIPQ